MGDKKSNVKKKSADNKNTKIVIGIILVVIIAILLFFLFSKKEVQHTVSFETNGGTKMESLVIDDNGLIKEPEAPTKEGYEFDGWYYNGELYDFSKPVTGDIKLEARWTKLEDVSGVELDQTNLTLGVDETAKLNATVTPENAKDKSLTWSSSDSDVVSVDEDGNIKALKAGKATITVTTKDGGYTAKAEITVKEGIVSVTGVSLNKTSLDLTVNASATLTATVKPSNATNKGVTWSSSDSSVATVDSNGKVTAKKAGKVTITVTTKDGQYKADCIVEVTKIDVTGVSLNKTSLDLNIGGTYKLAATIKPSNATNKGVTWSSSDTSIATVDSNGKVTAKKAGTVTITVTTKDGKFTEKCTVKVTEVKVTGVSLNKTSLDLTVGGTYKLAATVKPSNATNKGVTWSSSDTSIATVDSNGKVTAKKAGTVTITVKTNDGGYTAKCTVTVKEKAASYSVIFTPIVQEGTGAVVQYEVAVNKNGSTFSNYSFVIYNNRKVNKGSYLSVAQYNKGVKTATVRLSDGSEVSATVVYK